MRQGQTHGAKVGGLTPGTRLGRYTLLRRFAVGGMAELYLARQRGARGFERIVALKRVLPHLVENAEFTRMFLDEARLAARLDHPNIAPVLDFGEEGDGEYFLTMEYVHGRNLLEVLRAQQGKPLPLDCALSIVVAVAHALHHVHEHRDPDGQALGLVHRDVSPSNVLVSYAGAVKLTDFGIAKAMERTSATRTGTFKGKLAYASPEQCRGETLDRRSDVFSLGILLYETTTGVRAFSAPNEFAVLGKIARCDLVGPEEIDPAYPEPLADILGRTLVPDPDDRIPTAAALADEIEAFAQAAGLRLSARRVAETMEASFGPAPSVTDSTLVTDSTDVDTNVSMRSHRSFGRGSMVAWTVAAVAVSAVGVIAWTRPAAEAPAAPPPAPAAPDVAHEPPVDPAALVVPTPMPFPTPPSVEAIETSATTSTEHDEAVAEPARVNKRKRKRRRERRREPPQEAPAGADRDALYPPGYRP